MTDQKNGDGPSTEYIVLEQVQLDPAVLTDGPVVAWRAVGTYQARGKSAAIRLHTGDGEKLVEGTFKAIPVSSWKGGVTTKRVTAAERLPLEDL